MNTRLRNTLIAIALTTCFTAASQASTSADVPSVSQDPVVQHLKLSEEQVAKIQALRQGFENNVSQIKISGYQDGALADVIHSWKRDEAKVQQQLAASCQTDQQVRYYRVKYYFDVSQVLTAEQREQVKKDLAAAIN